MIEGVRASERGFTLPELVAVVAILAILSAIAIPTFLSSRRRGWDGQAKALVRSGLAAERTYYVDHQAYTADAAALRRIEPNLNLATTDADQNGVMVAVVSDQVVVVTSTSRSGRRFCIMHIAVDQASAVNGQRLAGTYYASAANTGPPPVSARADQCGTTYTRSESDW